MTIRTKMVRLIIYPRVNFSGNKNFSKLIELSLTCVLCIYGLLNSGSKWRFFVKNHQKKLFDVGASFLADFIHHMSRNAIYPWFKGSQSNRIKFSSREASHRTKHVN